MTDTLVNMLTTHWNYSNYAMESNYTLLLSASVYTHVNNTHEYSSLINPIQHKYTETAHVLIILFCVNVRLKQYLLHKLVLKVYKLMLFHTIHYLALFLQLTRVISALGLQAWHHSEYHHGHRHKLILE